MGVIAADGASYRFCELSVLLMRRTHNVHGGDDAHDLDVGRAQSSSGIAAFHLSGRLKFGVLRFAGLQPADKCAQFDSAEIVRLVVHALSIPSFLM